MRIRPTMVKIKNVEAFGDDLQLTLACGHKQVIKYMPGKSTHARCQTCFDLSKRMKKKL